MVLGEIVHFWGRWHVMLKKLLYIAILLSLPYAIYYYGGSIDIAPGNLEIPPAPFPFRASLVVHNYVLFNGTPWVRTYDISSNYPLLTFRKSGIRQKELDEFINRAEVKMLFGDLSIYIPKPYPLQQ
jgi:hypothetical protein